MDNAERTELSDKELIFAEGYLTHLNKAKAARNAGSAVKSAKEQGHEIYNRPHVKAYIDDKLKERALSADETVKLISDTAKASLTDYYKPVKVLHTKRKRVGLADVIAQKRVFLKREYVFMERKGLTEGERDKFIENLSFEEDQILRLEIELEENPSAYRIMETEPVLVDEMQLDINALVADKENAKVKKIKYGKDGLEVELYSADAAQDKLMKMHGKYEKDNSQKKPESPVVNIRVIPPNDDE